MANNYRQNNGNVYQAPAGGQRAQVAGSASYGMGAAGNQPAQAVNQPTQAGGQPAQVGNQPAQNFNSADVRYVAAASVPANASGQLQRTGALAGPEPKKKKRGAGFWIGIVIAIVAIVMAIILCVVLFGPDQPGKRAGTLGQLEGKSEEEIIAELNRAVDEGMFNISISSHVDFNDGESEGELRIENVPGNLYLMRVDITRDDNGDLIYTSGVLEPNYHIQKDKLLEDLDAGEYECTAVFHALDPDTEEEVGTAAAKMTINIIS